MKKAIKKKTKSPKTVVHGAKGEFERYLGRIENPKNNQEVNYDLPENPTPLQVVKFDICQNILACQQDNNLSDEELLEKINCDLSIPELEEILFCQIDKFTLDRLMTYVNHLFNPSQVKITITKPTLKARKRSSVYAS
ncbi:MAG: hypothetical protein I3273_01145 [Candidatus Moeniiplasma glomeromycotorum]|nr:hypothetical protein [Candidatus Moeniiplasma glomeromycotorum]MCE8167272.1 hypothetical protein [Candidatus Moeniiplasma glomeromycotorum]MCE8168715.1 hypothetical protein [Candidatus Moeniiplasma glomeromycotorum]